MCLHYAASCTLRHQEEDIKGAAEVPVTTPTQEDSEVETDTDVKVNKVARADKEVYAADVKEGREVSIYLSIYL